MSQTNLQYRIHTQFIIVVTLLLMGLVFYIITPFMATLFIAAVIVTAVNPLHVYLKRRISSKILSSLIMWLTIILLFVIPVTILTWLLIKETTGVSNQITRIANQLPFFLDTLPERLSPYLPPNSTWQTSLSSHNFSQITVTLFDRMSSGLIKSATGLLAGLSLLFIHLIIFLFALFYFLFDGEKLIRYTKSLLPLDENQKKELIKKTTDLMQSIIYGLFGAAIAQGSLVGIGMAIVGITNPIFWGTVAIALAPIPYLGVGIVWVPTTLWLFSSGQWGQGVFFLAWCLVFVMNIDNIIKPYLIGARSLLHPFAVMIVIIGGVLTLGFKGLIFGPLLLTLLLAFLHIYQLEFANKNIAPQKKA